MNTVWERKEKESLREASENIQLRRKFLWIQGWLAAAPDPHIANIPVHYCNSMQREVSPGQYCWALKVKVNEMSCDYITVWKWMMVGYFSSNHRLVGNISAQVNYVKLFTRLTIISCRPNWNIMGGMEIFAKEAEQFCHLYASKMLALWGSKTAYV